MNTKERNALDRHITGNYGEDQMKGEAGLERLIESANLMCNLIQQWRESGTVPSLRELTAAHDDLLSSLSYYK